MVEFTLTKSQKGEIFLFSEALLWSLFPIIAILTFSSITPLMSLALSTLLAALFFAVVLTIRKQWNQIMITSAWKDILMATVIIGIIFYGLFFIGLKQTSAGNASIISQMEVFFTMLILGGLWKKEKLTGLHFLGAALMVLGAVAILFPGTFKINSGDLIILIAVAIPPVGNYFTQRARRKVSSTTIMFIRDLISGIFLLGFAFFIGQGSKIEDIVISMPFVIINGILLFGVSKILWVEAIHRITITKAISLQSILPAFTLLFAFFILGEIPTIWQFAGLIPIVLGILLLTDFGKK